MTREEAIERIKEIKDRAWGYHIGGEVLGFMYDEFMEIMDAALSSLRLVSREQVEKVWRGEWEWYDEEVGNPLDGIERDWGWRCSKCKVVLPDDFDDPDNPPAMRFCPNCGAAMTNEAMGMVMERLEVLKDNTVQA